jgi:hypothetical protein
VLQDAAAKKLSKCVHDEAGHIAVLPHLLQKHGPMALDDLIRHGLSRVSPCVGSARRT